MAISLRCIGIGVAAVAVSSAMPQAAADPGVNVPAGFEVSLYADDNLAHNIYAMTIDARGRIVVSGPGYVRVLIDTDGDGKADAFKQFADGPKSGAQGMCFHGRDLLCTGDAGLLRYRDRNGDDKADGPPDVFLKMKTGAEHHAHAIRKGPDGWWYVIAGNFAGINAKYATLPTSPVRLPHGGTILRLKPDLSGGEIYCDGFRNAYDFAFNDRGDVFTYDSDGERAVSLPWYRPTRVFQALPASYAGWITRSWKRPGSYVDMPPVIAAFGRGSPTGVACYRHRRFPAKYHNAVFALDWTFGRVLALPLERDGSIWKSTPETFMTARGEYGFAPTDIAVGPDGSLFVSVGGRGTRGGVFRVRYVGDVPAELRGSDVDRCLNAPQPLASWSRARWMPLAKKLGGGPFRKEALNAALTDAQRIRAVEILTEMFGGLTAADVLKLAKTESADVRARAVWSHGRTHAARPNTLLVQPFLDDKHPAVRRAAVAALLGADGRRTDFESLVPQLARRLGDDDRFVRQLAMHVVRRLSPGDAAKLRRAAQAAGAKQRLAFDLGRLERTQRVDLKAFGGALAVFESSRSAELRRDALRVMQLALGGCGPREKRPPVFDSVASPLDLKPYERGLDAFRIKLAKLYPSGDAAVDYELARVIAMLAPYNSDLLTRILAQITVTSHPVADIHYLVVAARIPSDRTARQRAQIARAFVALDAKIRARKLKVDLHWQDRVGEAFHRHAQIDPDLPEEVIAQNGFGEPNHVFYLKELADKHWQKAIDRFVKRIQSTRDYRWNNDVVFLMGESENPAHVNLVRAQFDNFGLRNAILLVLARKPAAADRAKFVRGLESGQLNVVAACERALGKLPRSKDGTELVALYRAARRMGRDKAEVPVRDALVKHLQAGTGQNFGYAAAAKAGAAQPAAMQRWERWLAKTFPEAARLLNSGGESWEQFQTLLSKVDWTSGDASRGRALFQKRSCVQCHNTGRALGPDLAGVARRFSRADFFTAVVRPNRDVSPRYQTTQIITTRGKSYTGLVVYDSVDGVTLRTGNNQTIRVEAADIERRRQLNTSLMPTGLLKGLKPRDLADLYAYVRSLRGNAR